MTTNGVRSNGAAAVPVLGARALDRATLARQLLPHRSGRFALDARAACGRVPTASPP
ncbi:hypothetical protein [Streptomyces sp. AGS-58]|uniref:hypothetical protein n=1 Tax=unclassified Streptomyces TaxID=2593676 RepID=UPI0035A35FD0